MPELPKATVQSGNTGAGPGISAENAAKHAFIAWAFVAVAVTAFVHINFKLSILGPVGSALVAVSFLYVPMYFAKKRKEDIDDYGFHMTPVKKGLGYALTSILIIYPFFTLLYFAFYEVACDSHLLSNLVPHGMCARYGGLAGLHAPKLTPSFFEFCAVQFLVVALPEELFFRGFLLGLLEKAYPPKRRILGGGVGKALLLSALAFSLIHLPKDGDPRALATFFPALLFGWIRSATNSIFGSTCAHASANILIRFLDLITLR